MSGHGGNEYAELGIAVQDSIAADARMKGKDGLSAQQKWAAGILGDRVWSFALITLIVVTPAIWMNAGEVLRGVWLGLLLVLGVGWIFLRQNRAESLDTIRKRQLAEHRAGKEQSE